MPNRRLILTLSPLFGLALFTSPLRAQIPVEIFAGNDRATVDVMFFRSFDAAPGGGFPFLFFNRNRASVNYHNATAFGSTNAVSYNWTNGLGAVVVAQIFSNGFFPKGGLQYYTRQADIVIFTWLVTELLSEPAIDWFVLARFEPVLTDDLKLFTQLELLNTVDTGGGTAFVQRGRLGVKSGPWQAGVGVDFSQQLASSTTSTQNYGLFLRHEF
jgi:hypothetical protein